MPEAQDTLLEILAKKFIARRDVKAIQRGHDYFPVTDREGNRLPWKKQDIIAHLDGRQSYGHYLVNTDNQAKLLAFDIDLTKWNPRSGRAKPTWVGIDDDGDWTKSKKRELKPREAWLHKDAPVELRRFLITQMRGVAEILATCVMDVLEVPVAVSYSGNKGLHVYAMTGLTDARELRGAAQEVLQYSGEFVAERGKNFFRHKFEDPITGYPCIDIEVFPKQDSLTKKDLGNLMRLPLGINKASSQGSYFLDLSSPIDELQVADPLKALEGGDPWQV